jgi:hypothetical protein
VTRRFALLLLAASAACGRLNYDALEEPPPIGAADAPSSGACPADTAPIEPGAAVCIELAERGTTTWVAANDACANLGRRLCRDAEWAVACEKAVGLADMAGGADTTWEWMLEQDGTLALKRGIDVCTDTSSHEIANGDYDFRCCVDR